MYVDFLVFMVEKSDCAAKNMVFMSGNSVWGVSKQVEEE